MLLLHLKVNIILFYLTILLANFRPIKASADLNYANQLIGMYFKSMSDPVLGQNVKVGSSAQPGQTTDEYQTIVDSGHGSISNRRSTPLSTTTGVTVSSYNTTIDGTTVTLPLVKNLKKNQVYTLLVGANLSVASTVVEGPISVTFRVDVI